MDFQTALTHEFVFEGGLVDHPKDPGGITKYGISLRSYPHLGEDGIRNLTKETAGEIYRADYWDATSCDDLPPALRLMTFDCAINQGANYARRALQVALRVPADGIIGPLTLKAAHEANLDEVLHRFAMNRYSRYSLNKNWDTFGDGWMNRLLKVCLIR